MPQVCKLCSHPDRLKADKLIIQGEPNSRIASKFGCSEISVRRHRAHVAEALAKGMERRAMKIGDSLADQAQTLIASAQEVYDKSREYFFDEDGKLLARIPFEALKSISVAIEGQRRVLETLAKVTGQMASTEVNVTQINLVNVAPVIYQVLEKHPTALKAVQEALLARSG